MDERTIWEQLAAPFADSELEWKPQTMGKKNGRVYALLVPYVQARAIMDRLDVVVGPENWATELRPVVIKGEEGFVCKLRLNIDGDEPYREDVAPASDIEAMKGAASGALKRVAVQFGIGRYLYGLPQYWAQDIVDGYPPKGVDDAILLKSNKDDIVAWCHAPKLDGVPATPPITRTAPKKAQEGTKQARTAQSEPEVDDIPREGPPVWDEDDPQPPEEAPKTAEKPKWKGIRTKNGETGEFVRDMKSKFNDGFCAFCGEKHIMEGDEIICVKGIPGQKKDPWGDRTCYANWCAQVDAEG